MYLKIPLTSLFIDEGVIEKNRAEREIIIYVHQFERSSIRYPDDIEMHIDWYVYVSKKKRVNSISKMFLPPISITDIK